MQADAALPLATPAVQLDQETYEKMVAIAASGKAGGTMVTFDLNKKALYFSKQPIPFLREHLAPLPVYKHLGIYAYRYETLKQFVALAPTPLEQTEGLEQLRALEHGIPIQVVEVDFGGRKVWSVDNPEDAEQVAALIAEQGELV
jgi:3-deoxy-manno-octulosonate cytidylyltransferase (CMP-KDO synthetase)